VPRPRFSSYANNNSGPTATARRYSPTRNTMELTEKMIRDALKKVKDPELNIDLVTLGLVYDIQVQEAEVKAIISLTTPMCPVAGQIVEEARLAIAKVDGVEKAEVELTFDPPWTPERISPLIRSSLGL
jgi:metal-sulfur cluster biosynthetic enzyme